MTPVPSQYEYKEHKTLSHLKLVALSNRGPQLFSLNCSNPNQTETLVKDEGYPEYLTAEIARFSPIHGQTLAVVDNAGIHLIDIASKQERLFIKRKGVIALQWSPKESYVISCEKQRKDGEQNLCVWNAADGKLVIAFAWNNTAKDGPKSIKFDDDEKFCARQVGKNVIEVYEAGNFTETKMEIRSKLPPLPKVDGEV